MNRKLKKREGFTLIELMIVVVIIGMLALVTMPKFNGITSDAKIAQVQGNLANMRTSIAMHYVRTGEYPSYEGGFSSFSVAANSSYDISKDGSLSKEFSSSYSKEKFAPTPGVESEKWSIGETSQVVPLRNNQGGWYYYEETGDIYANIANGVYTGGDDELWDDEKNNPLIPSNPEAPIEDFPIIGPDPIGPGNPGEGPIIDPLPVVPEKPDPIEEFPIIIPIRDPLPRKDFEENWKLKKYFDDYGKNGKYNIRKGGIVEEKNILGKPQPVELEFKTKWNEDPVETVVVKTNKPLENTSTGVDEEEWILIDGTEYEYYVENTEDSNPYNPQVDLAPGDAITGIKYD